MHTQPFEYHLTDDRIEGIRRDGELVRLGRGRRRARRPRMRRLSRY